MNLLETSPDVRNSTEAVLSYLHQLLHGNENDPLQDILAGLVRAFEADGGGLGVMLEEPAPQQGPLHLTLAMSEMWGPVSSEPLPWERDAELLGRVRDAGQVCPISTAEGGVWLLAPVRQASAAWLLWLTVAEPRVWTEGEKSCLALAGHCVVERLLAGPARSHWLTRRRRLYLQEGINRAAVVTRRLAHDFCNILTSISGYAELALLNLPADAAARRFAQEVLESARQGARWSQRLQVFSQQRQQRHIPASLAELLREEQVKPDWQRGVSLQVDLPDGLPSVDVEPASLRLALSAILENAREAIAGPGTVSVTARLANLSALDCLELLGSPRPGVHVELVITDSGGSMPANLPDYLPRDMFSSNKGRRRGLGLAAVCGIMQSYQGGFRIDPARGLGTAVTMLLPLAVKTR